VQWAHRWGASSEDRGGCTKEWASSGHIDGWRCHRSGACSTGPHREGCG
jgi:hypothetical protein